LLSIGLILHEIVTPVGGVVARSRIFVTLIVPLGSKIVVPAHVLTSTELSQIALPEVMVSVTLAVPSVTVMIGAVARVVTVVDESFMKVVFVALCALKLQAGNGAVVAAKGAAIT
jgi:hypothetical protein